MHSYRVVSLVVSLVVLTSASPNTRRAFSRRSDDKQEELSSSPSSSSSWLPSVGSAEYNVIRRVLDDCIKSGDGANCLKGKAVTFLDRVARLKSIPLFDGISFSRQKDGGPELPALNENELEASLPRDLSQKSDRLDQMIYDRLLSFWNSHSLTMDFSAQNVEEGRRRKHKKLFGHLLMGLAAAAATLGPIAFKGLAALAFKALIAAKIALVLSSILALKSLSHHGGGGGDSHRSYAVQETEAIHHWPMHEHEFEHGRSFSESSTEQAHRMAYNAQLQRPITVA